MKMRYLPGTDTLVTELGLGAMTFGEQTCKENALKMLDEAVYKFGINLIVRLVLSHLHAFSLCSANCAELTAGHLGNISNALSRGDIRTVGGDCG
jgi:hypothetical protein